MPLPFLLGWLFGLAALALVGAGVYWTWAWAMGALPGAGPLVLGLMQQGEAYARAIEQAVQDVVAGASEAAAPRRRPA